VTVGENLRNLGSNLKRAARVIFLSLCILAASTSFAETEDNSAISSAESEQADLVSREPAATRKGGSNRQRSNPRNQAAKKSVPKAENLEVSKIEVKGNRKIETDAILARLVTKVGEPFSSEKVRQDVAALFAAGYFYDIQVDREIRNGRVELTYRVVEKPSLVEIHFSGNKEVGTDDLKEAAGLKAYEILNMTKVREAAEKIQKLYEDKGYFLARVTPRIETVVEGESVKLTFDIQENDKVKVMRITFLGNKHIPDGRLKSLMQTQEGGFFSFVTGSGAYKQDTFDRDLQVLQYVGYFNEGFLLAKFDRPQVYVTPDKKGIYITIRVDEGERFKIGTIDFAGDLLFDRDELFETVESRASDWFNHERLLKDLRSLQAKYGDLGYAYANIIPRMRFREQDREVDITFEIDKGNKVYFGRINVIGNTRTRDKVIRRELAIREGELYNETRKRESMDNVRRLGFFDEVNFNAKTPPDNPDVMDIDIVVKERNTGTIQVGAGYSTYSQFIFNGQVNQINLFGRGQRLGLSVDLSSNQSLFNFNFTEPYFMDTEWSVGVDAYQSRRLLQEYRETKKGGALRLGHPLAKYLRGYLRYKLDETEIDLDETYGDPTLFPTGKGEPGSPNGLTSSATVTLEYDKRNDRYAPTDGVYSSASLEYAGLGGDLHYTKGIATARWYKRAVWELVVRNNLTYGFVRANPGAASELPPYNELFLLGGANSLRGYSWFTVGKKKLSERRRKCYTGETPATDPFCKPFPKVDDPNEAIRKAMVPYGGTQQLYYQFEIEFPLVTEAGIKGVVFYDIGLADDDIIWSEFRQDYGFGFRWFSPIGPLRFEWGFPIDRRDDERAVEFSFAIGSPF